MKKGWPWKPLGEVCKTGSGGTPLSSQKEYYEGGNIPWLLSGEVAQGNVRESKNFITKAGLENSAARLFPKDTVLVAMYGATAGQVGILRFEAATNQAVCGILPNDTFVPEFLFYFLLAKKDELIAQATGNAQPNISQIKIKNTEVPVPPLAEQQRIVGLLDEAFEGLATANANAEKNLQNARAIFESHLQSVFTQRGKGWVEKLLGDVCETTQGVQIPKNLHFKSPGENRRRYLYISDFDHDENLKYVDDIFPKKRVTENDLIVVNTGATAGKIFRGIDGVLSNNLFKVTLNQGIDADFLYYFVTSSLFKEHQKKIVKGTANPHMGHENFKSTPVNIPPLDVQLETATKLDDLREETQRLARIYERKLAALAELKKSLLHQAFTGEL